MSSVVKCNLNEYLYQKGLTPRQIEVVSLTLCCMKLKDIANALSVELKTVKQHNTLIYRKMNVKNRNELLFNLKDYMNDSVAFVELNDEVDNVEVSVDFHQSFTVILPFGAIDEKARRNLEQIRNGNPVGA